MTSSRASLSFRLAESGGKERRIFGWIRRSEDIRLGIFGEDTVVDVGSLAILQANDGDSLEEHHGV